MHRIFASLMFMLAACGSDDSAEFPVAPGGSTAIGAAVPGVDAGTDAGSIGDGGPGDGGLGPDASGSLDAPTGLPDSAGGSLDAPLGLPDSAGGSLDAPL